jgi:anti-sigma B factor antagonist
VSVSTRADHAVVTMAGELDVAATGTLGRRLSALVGDGFVRIVIDLADLVFCDASGLGMLIKTAGLVGRRGGWLRIAAAGPMIDRIIGITGLRRVLPAYGTVEDALLDATSALPGVLHGLADG